jgi:hypothetical protein
MDCWSPARIPTLLVGCLIVLGACLVTSAACMRCLCEFCCGSCDACMCAWARYEQTSPGCAW